MLGHVGTSSQPAAAVAVLAKRARRKQRELARIAITIAVALFHNILFMAVELSSSSIGPWVRALG